MGVGRNVTGELLFSGSRRTIENQKNVGTQVYVGNTLRELRTLKDGVFGA